MTPKNKSRDQYKRLLIFFISLFNLILLSAAFGYVWYHCYADVIPRPFFRKGNWLVIGIYALLLFVFTNLYGGYRVGTFKRGNLIFSGILSALIVNGITYLQISLIGRNFLAPIPMLFLSAVDGILLVIWAIMAHALYHKLYPPQQMLLIYGDSSAKQLVYKMSAREDKYMICDAINVAKGLQEVYKRIDQYESVIIYDIKAELRNKILKYCYDRSVRIYLTPKISDTIIRGADAIDLFDTPLLFCRSMGLSFEQRFAKRALDLLIAVIVLILASPFMLLTAIAIKLYDGGPVFYKQERLTLNGKIFVIYKFRSMVVGAEEQSGAVLASKNDDRITPVGKFIRKTRLDELPQILNIIKGDMSIVGPRPERPEIAEQYDATIPEFSYRLKVKAGLTGYAQVIGKYNTTALDKLKLDLMYIQNYSFLLDLKLIFMTLKVVFQRESTEGVDKQPISVMAQEDQEKKKEEKETILQ